MMMIDAAASEAPIQFFNKVFSVFLNMLNHSESLTFCSQTQSTSCPLHAAAAQAGLRTLHHSLPSVTPPLFTSVFSRLTIHSHSRSYTSQQIHDLLQHRLSLAAPHCGRMGIFEERALDFCARKCAGLTGGDFRRCLDFCRHALAASLERQQKQGGELAHVSYAWSIRTLFFL